MATEVSFEVEQAGCPSCADRVREALEPLGAVGEIGIDEDADLASVRCSADGAISENSVNDALAAASDGAGHAYRVRPGSWRTGE